MKKPKRPLKKARPVAARKPQPAARATSNVAIRPTAPATYGYTRTAISLHWVMAALIVFLLALGWLLAEDYIQGPNKGGLISLHKQLGIAVLALVAIRLSWRANHPAPRQYADVPFWMRAGAVIAHLSLYALMLLMPLDGWMFSNAAGHPVTVLGYTLPTLVEANPGLAQELFELHEFGMWAFIVLVGLHALAAVYHHVARRDDTLRRMLPFLQPR